MLDTQRDADVMVNDRAREVMQQTILPVMATKYARANLLLNARSGVPSVTQGTENTNRDHGEPWFTNDLHVLGQVREPLTVALNVLPCLSIWLIIYFIP